MQPHSDHIWSDLDLLEISCRCRLDACGSTHFFSFERSTTGPPSPACLIVVLLRVHTESENRYAILHDRERGHALLWSTSASIAQILSVKVEWKHQYYNIWHRTFLFVSIIWCMRPVRGLLLASSHLYGNPADAGSLPASSSWARMTNPKTSWPSKSGPKPTAKYPFGVVG